MDGSRTKGGMPVANDHLGKSLERLISWARTAKGLGEEFETQFGNAEAPPLIIDTLLYFSWSKSDAIRIKAAASEQ